MSDKQLIALLICKAIEWTVKGSPRRAAFFERSAKAAIRQAGGDAGTYPAGPAAADECEKYHTVPTNLVATDIRALKPPLPEPSCRRKENMKHPHHKCSYRCRDCGHGCPACAEDSRLEAVAEGKAKEQARILAIVCPDEMSIESRAFRLEIAAAIEGKP